MMDMVARQSIPNPQPLTSGSEFSDPSDPSVSSFQDYLNNDSSRPLSDATSGVSERKERSVKTETEARKKTEKSGEKKDSSQPEESGRAKSSRDRTEEARKGTGKEGPRRSEKIRKAGEKTGKKRIAPAEEAAITPGNGPAGEVPVVDVPDEKEILQTLLEAGFSPLAPKEAPATGEVKKMSESEEGFKIRSAQETLLSQGMQADKKIRIARKEAPGQGIDIDFTDARTGKKKKIPAEQPVKRAVRSPADGAVEAFKPASETAEIPGEGESTNVRVMELGGENQRSEGSLKSFTATENRSPAASFGEILKEKGISQVVKQTGILLKDDNQGEIKLILKPEALGKVRIRLNLEDNRIAGRIIVENSSVKEAFSQNLDELQRALKESGFESARLDVSVEGDHSHQGHQGRDRRSLRPQGHIVESLEEGLPRIEPVLHQESRVNLMA